MTGAAPDVAVIGAGILGVSVAEQLAAAGASVRVFEAHAVAAAASGRNSGVVQYPFDPVLAELHLGTLERYRRLVEEEPKLFGLPAEPSWTPAGQPRPGKGAGHGRRVCEDASPVPAGIPRAG